MTEHSHSYTHAHSSEKANINRAFSIGIALNILFVLIEMGSGFYYNSLSLISDAGHNLTDVASLLLALLAFRLAKVKPDSKYTYGYRKTTILVSLVNSVFLLLVVGAIVWESILRLQSPELTDGNSIAIIAALGILINGFTAFLFLKEKDKDLNIKGAYLHMAADTLVSIGVLFAGIIIAYTKMYWIDSLVSIIIAAVISYSTINLLKDSFKLSIDAVPEGIDIKKVKADIETINGILDIHHIHIWPISTTINSFTAHVKVRKRISSSDLITIKFEIRHKLLHQNIEHSTIEFEFEGENCEENQL